jgi:hypothetical protein
LNRAELYKQDAALQKQRLAIEDAAARKIRRLTIDWVRPIVEAVKTGARIPRISGQEIAENILEITKETSEACVNRFTALYAQAEADILNKLTETQRKTLSAKIEVKTLVRKSGIKEKPVIKRYTGSAWGGAAVGYKINKRGKVEWTPSAITWIFTRKYNLSGDVWKTVSKMEGKIYALVEADFALGRDPVDTVSDIETFIKYKDGGARVAGRWANMLNKTDANISEGWQREFINKNYPKVQWGTDDAKRLLDSPQAQQWIDANSFGKNGRKLLPPQVKAYSTRIGAAGLDYRAIRIVRTETARALGDRQKEIAKSSPIYTGRVIWILDKNRDRWDCECTKLGGKSYDVNSNDILNFPPHPNCACRLRPELKSDDEIRALMSEGAI